MIFPRWTDSQILHEPLEIPDIDDNSTVRTLSAASDQPSIMLNNPDTPMERPAETPTPFNSPDRIKALNKEEG